MLPDDPWTELLGLSELVWDDARQLPDQPTPAHLQTLRARHPEVSGAQWAGVVSQTLLRRRAAARYGPVAHLMRWTRTGLEQASRAEVAVRRATRLHAAGVTQFVDLGCGVGIDSAAAARSGLQVLAIEYDQATAAAARANLALLDQGPRCVVRVTDALRAHLPPDAVAFVDPSRRAGSRADGTSRRVLDPQSWQPPWSWVEQLAQRHPRTLVKAAPGIAHDLLPQDAAVEWVSVNGALVEVSVAHRGLVVSGQPLRSAVLLTPALDPWGVPHEKILSGTDAPAPVGPLGQWLLEPDPAIVRAHLVGALADQVAGHVVSTGIAYVTTQDPPPQGWGRVDRIVDVLPAKSKPLRLALRARGIATVEIRTRGLALDPQQLRQELKLTHRGASASLVLTRLDGRAVALLVEPAGQA